jgi:hypothetical protein
MEEKRGTKGKRTQCIKRGKKGSLSKEKASEEERKANVVVMDV